jgi:hypothetical protein
MSGFAKFGPLDQLDWLIVLLAVIVAILAGAPFSGSSRVVSGVGFSNPANRGRLQSAAEDHRSSRPRPGTFEQGRLNERGNMHSLIHKTFDRADVLMSAGCSTFVSAALILVIPRFGIAVVEILIGLLLMGCAFAARARLRGGAHEPAVSASRGAGAKWFDRYDLAMILTLIVVQAVVAGSLRRLEWSGGTVRMFPLILLGAGILLKPRLLRSIERRTPRKEEVGLGTPTAVPANVPHAGDGLRRDFDEKGVR